MNILYLIGNGFDMNLGLKTGYSDFYKYYVNTESKSEDVKNLKDEIIKEGNWSDLESSLGEYTVNFDSSDRFMEVLKDIGDSLADYVEREEKKLEQLEFNQDTFFDYLCFPEKSITDDQKSILKGFKDSWKSVDWHVDVISFNYTNTFEMVMGDNKKIGTHDNQFSINYEEVKHIHGYHNQNMVLGVNDNSQVANEKFRNDREIYYLFIKNNCNKAIGHTMEITCERLISKANLICLFGLSIGDTDKIWWKAVARRLLNNNTKLLIFGYSNKGFSKRWPQYKKIYAEDLIEEFLNKTGLNNERKELVKRKILYGINTDFFSNIVKEQKQQ